MNRIFVVLAMGLITISCADAQILNQKKAELFALQLVETDLKDATRAMTVYDHNDDGLVDPEEQKRLPWRGEVADYDLHPDGKLTHLEFAIRYAKRRTDAGVEQSDINNAQIYMRRHDENGNGQLDPAEIEKGWPNEPEEFDKNGDGIITLGEIAARFSFMKGLRREMGIEQVDQVTAIRMVRNHDQNRDKMLDADEQAGAPLPRAANDFDENKDGKLEIMEIATMLAKHRRETGLSKSDLMRVRSLFERFDPDGDSKLVLNEILRLAPPGEQQALSAMDADEDGSLTRVEVEKFFAKQRDELGFNDDHLAEARKLMTRHDQNRSQFIEPFELPDQPGEGQLGSRLLKTADENQDKKISLDELARHLAKKK